MPPFIQDAPTLPHPWREDRTLQALLRRRLGAEMEALAPELDGMGTLALEMAGLQAEDRLNEPRHVAFDPWGRRVDRIELVPLWRRAAREAAERGLVATAHEARLGALSRVHQMALVYLFHASSDMYTCPLAMSDGAAAALKRHGARPDALARLTSRDPERMWTSGQWMTESTGGSDVGLSLTEARRGEDGAWRLWGRKWFTSAAASEMALTLARPEGNPPGGKGLALFFVECRDGAGLPRGFRVNRLKDKLGTRKLPTAELDLEGMPAEPVAGLGDGIRAIAPMLNVTRTWNAVCAAASLRRGLALARDYAHRRRAFGGPLSEKPLHLETLAGVAAESRAATQLAFHAAAVLGRMEHGEPEALARIVAPLAKLLTAKQAVAGLSELVEAFGGAGYVEDTGIPVLLRDAQVMPIWEGTTNVLALESLKALAAGGAEALRAELEGLLAGTDPVLAHRARRGLAEALEAAPRLGEAGARRVAMRLARSLSLALLLAQAAHDGDGRALLAARRFALHGLGELEAGEGSAELALED